jgi:hypothetical protein
LVISWASPTNNPLARRSNPARLYPYLTTDGVSMDHGLAAHVSFCRFRDRWIFLDLAHDRYVSAKIKHVPGEQQPGPSAATIERLIEAGLLARGEHAGPLMPPSIMVPLSSCLERNAAPHSLVHMPAALKNILRTRAALRRRPLLKIIQEVWNSKDDNSKPRSCKDDLAGLVASFHHMRRRLPFAPRCLPDSLALLAYLDRYGYQPTLVFGVMAQPFAAHCWVQNDTLLLNDNFGHASQFTPILVV